MGVSLASPSQLARVCSRAVRVLRFVVLPTRPAGEQRESVKERAKDRFLLIKEEEEKKQNCVQGPRKIGVLQQFLLEKQKSFEQSKLDLHQQYQRQIGISKLYTGMGIVFTGVLTTLMLFLLALPYINYELAAGLVVDYFNWISN